MAADVAAFAFLDGAMQVLLVRRRYEPYESYWALPGGGAPQRDGEIRIVRVEV